jgi:hypothetical protein
MMPVALESQVPVTPLREPARRVKLPMLWREHENSPLILAFLQAAREISAQFDTTRS